MWSSVKYKKYTVTRCWCSLLLQTVKLELASQTYIKTFSIQDISYLLVVLSAKKGKATTHSESTDHGPLTSFFCVVIAWKLNIHGFINQGFIMQFFFDLLAITNNFQTGI